MFIATAVLSILLTAMLTFSAVGKLRRDAAQMATMQSVGFPTERVPLLATAELAGAAGLLIGLFIWPIGVAAAVGVTLYFAGAVGFHLRARDGAAVAPAAALLVAAIATLVLRILSA